MMACVPEEPYKQIMEREPLESSALAYVIIKEEYM